MSDRGRPTLDGPGGSPVPEGYGDLNEPAPEAESKVVRPRREGRTSDARAAMAAEPRLAQARAAEAAAAAGRSAEPQGSAPGAAGSNGADAGGEDPSSVVAPGVPPNGSGPAAAVSAGMAANAAEVKRVQARNVRAKAARTKAARTRSAAARTSEAGITEARITEAPATDTRTTDGRTTDGRTTDGAAQSRGDEALGLGTPGGIMPEAAPTDLTAEGPVMPAPVASVPVASAPAMALPVAPLGVPFNPVTYNPQPIGRGAAPPRPPAQLPRTSRRRQKVRVVRSTSSRRLIRRLDTWTVFKVSFLFYLLGLAVLIVAGVILWDVATAFGTITSIQKSVRSLFDLTHFVLKPIPLLEYTAAGGAVLALLGTIVNTLAALLYNLISDVIGGVQVVVVSEPD